MLPPPTMECDPYGALAADETAVKAALDGLDVRAATRDLARLAQWSLADAGIEGRTVRVVVEVTIAEGSSVAGAPLEGSSVAGAPLVVVRP